MSYRLIAVIVVLLAVPHSLQAALRVEAEDGELAGVHTATATPGYSGKGYVTGFDANGDRIAFRVQAKAGIYDLTVRYSAPHGEKGCDIAVNGRKSSVMLPATKAEFASHSAGKVELVEGVNKIDVLKGWGWYDVDYIELTPAKPVTSIRKPPKTLANPRSTTATYKLLSYLIDIYGSKTLSGQYDQYDGTEIPYIREVTGRTPAVLGGDLMDYTSSRIARGADPKKHVENLIKSAREGYIITLCWHWNAPKDLLDTPEQPWYSGFYTAATKFDLKLALENPDSEDYKLLLKDIDTIAVQLKKFADANVPVLWRPLHEAEGGWFWWGAKGPEAYMKLWKIMFDRLTTHHNLHNLIWVHNCVKQEWYPGDKYVDIVGVDAYPTDPGDPLSRDWEDLIKRFDGRKLLALTEFGGVPDVERMHKFGVRWSFFATWPGSSGPRKMSKEELIRIYRSPLVGNREEKQP